MDPITMMVASVGIQFFTNFANNNKNKEIQAQQREFQKAVTERDFDRMRRAQAATAKLALELEADVHKERLEDIEDNYDKLLQDFAHNFAISNWPLNVLPFIMKGESFGSMIGGTAKSINMHCILTPSNCDWFNEYFYDELDIRVEAEMNNHWNAQSTHPVVYYGGGWNRRETRPSGFSIIKPIDLDDIALLKNQLNKIPTMVITPYFDPYLHFRVQLWGMGKDSETPFRIDPYQGDVNIKDRIFSYDYNKDSQPELTDDFYNTTMEEFVPYLTSLIGFVADKYFWGMYGKIPFLPQLIQTTPEYNRLKNFFKNNYLLLLQSTLSGEEADGQNDHIVYDKNNIMSLYIGSKPIISIPEQEQFINNILRRNIGIENLMECEHLGNYFIPQDISFLEKITDEISNAHLKHRFIEVYNNLKSQIACSYVSNDNLTFLDVMECAKYLSQNNPQRNIKVEIHDNFISVALLDYDGKSLVNDFDNPKCYILFYKNFVVPQSIQFKSHSFELQYNNIDSIYNQIKKVYL